MKALPLLACLTLAAVSAHAEAASPTGAASQESSDLLNDIASWDAGLLPHVTPPDAVTREFEPRLNDITAEVNAATGDLTKPKKDFEAWQHDLLMRLYGQAVFHHLTKESLQDFSARERTMLRTYTSQNAQIQLQIKQTARAAANAAQFFDGGGPAQAGVAGGGYAFHGNTPGGARAYAVSDLHVSAPPPVTSAPLSLSSLWSWIDWNRGAQIAAAAARRATGFGESCYHAVKQAWADAKGITKSMMDAELVRLGIRTGKANQFGKDATATALNGLGYRRITWDSLDGLRSTDLPPGTVLDYNGCGFNKKDGHIEVNADWKQAALLRSRLRNRISTSESDTNLLLISDGVRTRATMAKLEAQAKQGCLKVYVPVTMHPNSAPPSPSLSI